MEHKTRCQFITNRGQDGRYYHYAACGLPVRSTKSPALDRPCSGQCTSVTPVGDRLHGMLEKLGAANVASAEIKPETVGDKKGCGGCRATQAMMNMLGPTGCRQQRPQLLAAMRKRYDALSTTRKAKLFVKAALLSIPAGLTFSISPTDPIGSLFDLAVAETEREILERANACQVHEPDLLRLSPGGVAP